MRVAQFQILLGVVQSFFLRGVSLGSQRRIESWLVRRMTELKRSKVLLLGASGAGKSTLMQRFDRALASNLNPIILVESRNRRFARNICQHWALNFSPSTRFTRRTRARWQSGTARDMSVFDRLCSSFIQAQRFGEFSFCRSADCSLFSLLAGRCLAV